MPNMFIRATDEELQRALRTHLVETEEHIKRLERILADEKMKDPAVDATGPIEVQGDCERWVPKRKR